jgi:hypothetical protein
MSEDAAAPAAGFDLNSFDALTKNQDDGVEVDILDPKTLDPIGLKIVIAGPDSDRQKKARRNILNNRLRKRTQKVTAEQIEEENLEVLAMSTVSWTFAEGVTIDGKVPFCNPKNAEDIYRRFPLILDQVSAQAGDRGNFTKS